MNSVSFKGVYVFPCARRGKDESWGQTSFPKIKNFLYDTKQYRTGDGALFLDNSTGDLYLSVDNDKEADFEKMVKSYKIDCEKKLDTLSGNKESADNEFKAFVKKVRERMAEIYGKYVKQ